MKARFERKEDGFFWSIFFSGIILLSVIGGAFFRVVLNRPAFGYYINYISWILLGIGFVLRNRKLQVNKEYYFILGIVILNAIVGAIFGKYVLQLRMDNFHQALLTGLSMLLVMGIEWDDYLKKEDVLIILKVIFSIGMVAAIYAMIFQNKSWIGVLLGRERSVSAWIYKSFFGQRNVFAYFCFLSSVAGMYLFSLTRRKRYLIGMLLLSFQIYITDSRTAILGLLLFYVLWIYLNLGKKGKIIFPIIGICVIICMFIVVDLQALAGRFYHESHSGLGDSGLLRLCMWKSGIQYLISHKAILNGMGFGSQDPYLVTKFELRSFHNAYMDILFQGGIILLGAYIYLILKVFKCVLRMGKGKYRYISVAFIISFLFGCLFDSSATLFSSNYEAVLATIMVCILSKVQLETKS